MTLTVETGSGIPDADAFADVAFVDAWHAARANAAWAGTDDAKEAAIRRATAWLSGAFGWVGRRRVGRAQALAWPRSGAVDGDGWSVPYDEVPDEVRQATAEAALRELVAPGSLAPDVTVGKSKVLTGVGDITWTPLRKSLSAEDMVPTLTVVRTLLAGLVAPAGAIVGTLVRA